jgi:REP element-mobilizing transposase RayT
MAHTYTCLLYHVVFSTKDRRKQIPENIQSRLWSYMGGIARTNNFKALAVGGVEDHCHLLLSLPPTITVAKAVQLIKAGSSKWMHEEVGRRLFVWQESYGANTIGVSQIPNTILYVQNQLEHHKRHTFDEELASIIKRHSLP